MPKAQESGFLEIGCNLLGQVIVQHGNLPRTPDGKGYIAFSPRQARDFARMVLEKADEAERGPRVVPRKRHVDMRQFEREMLGGGVKP